MMRSAQIEYSSSTPGDVTPPYKASDLEHRLARALEALSLAEDIMSYSRGDAWEREATEKDYNSFREIYTEFFPPAPAYVDLRFRQHIPEAKLPCPTCGKSFRGTKGIWDHSKSFHGYEGSHDNFRRENKAFIAHAKSKIADR
jgi:uncharacterized C2H2 Zn-finger protein